MNENRFWLDIGKKFFTVKVMKHHNRLLREAVDVTSLAVFKTRCKEIDSIRQVVVEEMAQMETIAEVIYTLPDLHEEKLHRVMEYAELEWSHQDNQVQFLALHRTGQESYNDSIKVNSAYLLINTWLKKVKHIPSYILIEYHFTAANSEVALAILISLKPFHYSIEEIQQPL
ncbi:hypothetical protein HGM15179_017994 [Zosterops borbonicus]|uniref:Uncharacterized protein n=1 Tax=Zosterops borbonicus TaxID=364589 RepID=A0A8K1FZU1_9PASS|nr:hypothetical protein HGM15179_017994 [Zosterops borbonicus]